MVPGTNLVYVRALVARRSLQPKTPHGASGPNGGRSIPHHSGVSIVRPGGWALAVSLVGLLLLLLVLYLMFGLSNQNAAQCGFAHVTLALAAAAFATALGGFLEVEFKDKKVGTYVRAGGALAVFVLILVKSPIDCQDLGGGSTEAQGTKPGPAINCDINSMGWEEYVACMAK
jgi:hypothetical protein